MVLVYDVWCLVNARGACYCLVVGCKGSEKFWIEQEESPFEVIFLV
jgi:hypothetical protein